MIRLHLPLRFIQGILLLLVIWVTLYAVFILLNKEYGPLKFLNKLPPSFVQKHPYFHYDMDSEEPQSSDMKCLLPRIHPFDPSIWGYIGRQRSVFCKHSKPQLTYIDNNGKLRYNKSDIQMPSNRIHESLECYWSSVYRGEPNAENDDSVVFGNKIEYVRRFVSTYKKKSIPFFGFSFLAELSHDTLPLISAADGHIEEFLKFLNDEGFLENTVLIVFSDHGHRFDNIRKTPIGAIEERMPFFSIRIPNYISSLQPEILENLWVNSGRLVVPFDIHATLMDILEFAVTGRPLGQSKPPEGDLGQSLFVEVPPDRTCINASVPDHYCVCEIASAIPVTDTTARSAAKATIDRINAMLHGEGPYIKEKCATLVLAAIRSAHILRKAEEEATPSPSTKVRIIIEAKPSKGIFEATVSVADDVAEVLGDISRINTFGSQSNCIRHWTLRKYCFCNN